MQLVTIMKIIATRAINTASQRFVGGAGLYWANPGARLTNAEASATGIVQSIACIIVWCRGQVNATATRYDSHMADRWFIWVILGYLAGSVPFAFLIGKAHGVDVRQVGSGNLGATNLGRALGRTWAVVCFGLDVLKGLVPVLVAGFALDFLGRSAGLSQAEAWQWIAVALAAVVGHMFPIWLGLRGGKGVATGLGALLGLWPWLTLPALGALVVWLITARLYRYVSLGSVVAAIALPLLVIVWTSTSNTLGHSWAPFQIVTAILAIMVVLRHRANLARIRAGTEPRMGRSG